MKQLFIPEKSEEKIPEILNPNKEIKIWDPVIDPNITRIYGSKKYFQDKYNQGFTKVSYGRGKWVDNQKIEFMWVFHHTFDSQVHTYIRPVIISPEGYLIDCKCQKSVFLPEALEENLKKNKVELSKTKIPLELILQAWKQ